MMLREIAAPRISLDGNILEYVQEYRKVNFAIYGLSNDGRGRLDSPRFPT